MKPGSNMARCREPERLVGLPPTGCSRFVQGPLLVFLSSFLRSKLEVILIFGESELISLTKIIKENYKDL